MVIQQAMMGLEGGRQALTSAKNAEERKIAAFTLEQEYVYPMQIAKAQLEKALSDARRTNEPAAVQAATLTCLVPSLPS